MDGWEGDGKGDQENGSFFFFFFFFSGFRFFFEGALLFSCFEPQHALEHMSETKLSERSQWPLCQNR